MKSILKEINNDVEKLEGLLSNDSNFTYSIMEGGFYTKDDSVVVSISRSPYQGCLYSNTAAGELNIEKWVDYVLALFKEKSE